jgi:outer membrane protein assembly factor BamD (BamD/ComL family)
MASEEKRPLKVFLCHASGDKPPVRELYKRLTTEGVDAWLDQEKLLPGQDWRLEIPRAVQEADVVVVCLSNRSVTKEGYVQKEIKFALDSAEEKPEGAIFLIPARLEDCPVPERLSRWQWVDLYEENGFIKLLRSLKLRAGAVGAVIEPVSYDDTDREHERRIDQLYTEGLAAFYTEDWDRACHRFQTILSEQPKHRNAAEKLAEAECQRLYARLYAQAGEACQSENWQAAITALEELSQKSANYKDSASLLRNARKQYQLHELYTEAKALHAAQKWQAVVRVFEQIASIEPNSHDSDGLYLSAQKEVAELDRIAELNDRYRLALHKMDSGNWYEARSLLENIHKSQTGFLETEKLLKKVEGEILMEEEKRRQNNEVNTLYEQAHGLVRSKKWRNALDKLDEIRRLDEHFPDTEGIAEKVQKELEREQQEAERQNQLSALYAESVRLLKEEKYQDAMDKWQDVRAIDPKYPDRQWVQRTARRKLAGSARERVKVQPQLLTQNTRIGWFVLLAALGFGLARLVQLNLGTLFRMDLPIEIGWGMRGMLQGLITAWVVQRVIPEWRWKALLTFAVCWAVIYPITRLVIVELSVPILTDLTYSLAPALSFIICSLCMGRKAHWSTYVLIFAVWTAAWMMGQSVADYLNPVLHGASTRWVICDIIAGGIGLWITTDLVNEKSEKAGFQPDAISTPGSARLLLWAFIGIVVIRAIWGGVQDWLRIWDVEPPTFVQFTSLFILGGCYGAVVALSMKRIASDWKLQHSLTVIVGWAFGMGMAIVLLIKANLDFTAVVIAFGGFSVAAAIRWSKPVLTPLKVVLIFLCWALAWKHGNMLGNFLEINFRAEYTRCFADATAVLLGLLGAFGVYEYFSKRLLTLTFIATIGFGLGNFIGTVLVRSLSLSILIEIPLQYALLGFIGGAVFELPSRNLKKFLIRGGIFALALIIGYFFTSLLTVRYLSLRNVIYGTVFGIAFGLSTRRVSIIAFLAILGSAIFTITAIYIAKLSYSVIVESVIRGALIGLVLGFAYAYVTGNMEERQSEQKVIIP